MSVFGPNASAAFVRSAERARLVLKPGDRLSMASACGGRAQTVTFSHWYGNTISSRSVDDLSAWNIAKVNGVPTCFQDEHGIAAVKADTDRFAAERVQRRRSQFQIVGAPA